MIPEKFDGKILYEQLTGLIKSFKEQRKNQPVDND